MTELLDFILCETCGAPIKASPDGSVARCLNGHSCGFAEGILEYTSPMSLADNKEVAARDRQARSYLSHSKVAVHSMRFREFCDGVPRDFLENKIALDLGCGPGPNASILLSKGCKVIAVDFSRQSLVLNQNANLDYLADSLYVCADLNRIRFAENAADVLVMSDFLQHLGDRNRQGEFLQSIFRSLKPGGVFYLTFFNINLKNLIKSDIRGNWGEISYMRNRVGDVLRMLPADIVVAQQTPMNLSTSVGMDRILSRLPYADWFARWMLLTGYRRPTN